MGILPPCIFSCFLRINKAFTHHPSIHPTINPFVLDPDKEMQSCPSNDLPDGNLSPSLLPVLMTGKGSVAEMVLPGRGMSKWPKSSHQTNPCCHVYPLHLVLSPLVFVTLSIKHQTDVRRGSLCLDMFLVWAKIYIFILISPGADIPTCLGETQRVILEPTITPDRKLNAITASGLANGWQVKKNFIWGVGGESSKIEVCLHWWQESERRLADTGGGHNQSRTGQKWTGGTKQQETWSKHNLHNQNQNI